MFRYRMSSKSPRYGWVLTLLIIGLLLVILASQIGGQQKTSSTQPPSTNGEGGAAGALLEFWQNAKAGFTTLWNGLTGADRARQVNLDLNAPADGSGEDEEDTPAAQDVSVTVEKPLTPDAFVPTGQSPQILIYHTHTHEAYTKQDGQDYVEAAKWRTTDNLYNIVRVGEALAVELASKYGIATLHDKTDNEYPKLGTAYSRSLKSVQKVLDANKDLKILIDLHRDAYNTGIDPPVATINGKKAARVMLVIGTGVGQTGVGFTLRPDWKKNLLLANAITDRLAVFDPNLVRKVSVKTGRYNQHLSPGAILIEVGNNQDTLEQALNSVPYLAQAIADAYNKMTLAAAPSATPAPPAATASPSPTPGTQPAQKATGTPAPADSPSPAPRVIDLMPAPTPKPDKAG